MINTIMRAPNGRRYCIKDYKYFEFINYLMPQLMNIRMWVASILISTLWHFINKFIFHDWEFLGFLVVVMTLDLITGMRKAYILKQFILSTGLRKTVNKGIQYFSFLIICHVLASFEVDGISYHFLDWLPKVSCVYLILVECKSVLENIYGIDQHFNVKFFINLVKDLIRVNKSDKEKF